MCIGIKYGRVLIGEKATRTNLRGDERKMQLIEHLEKLQFGNINKSLDRKDEERNQHQINAEQEITQQIIRTFHILTN